MYTERGIWLVIVAIIVVFVVTLTTSRIASGSYAAEYNTNLHSDPEAKCISLNQDVKSNLTMAHKKMSTDLRQLIDSRYLTEWQDTKTLKMQMERLRQFLPAGSVSPIGDRRVTDDLVHVYVYLKPPASAQTIEHYVWEVTDRDKENHLAVAWVEVKALETLASLDEVRTIRTVMPPLVRTGSVTTEGYSILRTADVRTKDPQNGTGSGVKVGIISDGVDHWEAARDSGDLPSDLTILSNTQGGDEGTALLEIVHDMVPDADLYFHDSGANEVAFNGAIDALVDAGCDVICDDVGWILEPFFENGIIATHLTSVLASNDIIYVSAAGNAGQKHYQGDYYNDGYDFHDFSRGSEPVYKYLYVNIPDNGEVIVVLQWNDRFGSSSNNYDLVLFNTADWSILTGSAATQDGDDDPLEAFSYTNTGGSTIVAEIDVVNYEGAAAAKTLEVYIYTSNGAQVYIDNIDPSDSIFGHPAVPDAIAVGAIAANDPGNDDIEPFSSQGPVTISYPSATKRPKPDLCGIDRVKITGAGGFGYWDGSNYRFNGTSAAAPHIAAVAAQIWGVYTNKTGDEIRSILYSSAVDLGILGHDPIFGYGRANASAAYGKSLQVSTNPASDIGTTSATLNGNLFSTGGLESQVWFEYGKTAAYESSTTKQPKSTPGTFSEGIAGLDDDTRYHFRAVASNSEGTDYGDDVTFTTDELVHTNIDVGVTSNITLANSSDLAAYLPPEYDDVYISDAVVLNVDVADDTPGNPADDAYTDITINVGDMNIVTCKVFKADMGFLPEVDDVTARPTVDGEPVFSRDLVNETVTIRLYVGDPLLGVIPAAGFELQLAEGYNMISIPLNDSSVINASDLAAKIGTSCTEVVRWDGTSQAYVSHIPGLPLNNFATTADEGYFVNVNNPTSVTFEGPSWTSPNVVSLISGYNMIGVPVNDSSVTTASTLAAKIGTSCTEVVKWDSNTQSYISHIPGIPLNDFAILGGQGYFVNMVNPTEVTFEGASWQD